MRDGHAVNITIHDHMQLGTFEGLLNKICGNSQNDFDQKVESLYQNCFPDI